MAKIAVAALMLSLCSGCADGRAETGKPVSTETQSTRLDAQRATTRRVLAGFSNRWVQNADPMPDGRAVATISAFTGDIAIQDIATRELRLLTHNTAPFEPGSGYSPTCVSSDGKRVAYFWVPSNDTVGAGELRIVDVAGGPPRTITKSTGWLYTEPTDWSPDGRTILAWRDVEDGTVQIILVPSDGTGPIRVLKTLDWRHPLGMNFSPDGRFIVYDSPPKQDSNNRDVYILAVDGSRETRVVSHAANDYVLGWAPDGRHILVSSDRSGSPSAWLIPVADGKARGEPILVKSDLWRTLPLGFTASGAYFYGVETGGRHVHITNMDSVTGMATGTPTQMTQSSLGTRTSIDWSPDGRSIAYQVSESNATPTLVVIRSLQTGETREFPLIGLQFPGMQRWLPDGSAILIKASEKLRRGVFRMDAQTGKIAEIVSQVFSFDVTPDGRSLVYVTDADTGILVRDMATGSERLLYRRENNSIVLPRSIAVSPDGARLAFFRTLKVGTQYKNQLLTMPMQGGEPRLVADVDSVFGWGMVRWARDGRSLLFTRTRWDKANQEAEVSSIWRVLANGGIPAPIALAGDQLREFALSTDGRRVAFAAGSGRSELWVMENFLPR